LIAVDTNVLVYAHREEFPLHARAVAALRALAEGDEAWALPILCVGEFVRVVSHPRAFEPPSPPAEALDFVDALLASPSVRLLHPGARYLALLRESVIESGAAGNLVFDATIVALCREHGAKTLLTEDRDFKRFDSVEVLTLAGFPD
jgi:toxin-antitoxin system PIN domain toxin